MFTKGQSSELAWVTSSNIPSPLKWFLGPFSDFACSLNVLKINERNIAYVNSSKYLGIGLMGVVNCTKFWKNPPAPLCPLFIHYR